MNIWLERWDRMQERYLVGRGERFAILAQLVQATQGDAPQILDLGCGTGSVMAALLEAIPGSCAVGMDMDLTLLALAEERLKVYGGRAQVLCTDLRQPGWESQLPPEKFDAIVSATALHWLGSEQLSALYARAAGLLEPGGIFLNADHVASDHPQLQLAWEQNRAQTLAANVTTPGEDWDSFWAAYLAELGPKAAAERQRILGEWHGIEAGQPLAWHLDQLRRAGFSSVDCFWRCDCDAIYGGILKIYHKDAESAENIFKNPRSLRLCGKKHRDCFYGN